MLAVVVILWFFTTPRVAAAPIGIYSDSPVEMMAMVPNSPIPHVIDPTDALLKRIEACESHGNPRAMNPHSSAKGLFQFLDGTWNHYGEEYWGSLENKDVFNPADNYALARYVVDTYGATDWIASKGCWQK